MTGLWIVGGAIAAFLLWKAGVLDSLAGKPVKPGVKPTPVVYSSASSLADQFLRRQIDFPEELLSYDSTALRKAASFIEFQTASLAHAKAWSDKQGEELVTAATKPLLPSQPVPK